MKLLRFLLLIGAVFSSAAPKELPSSDVESKIIAMEKAWNQAFKFRDTNAINAILDDDVVLVNDDGSLQSKAVFVAGIREAKPSEEQQVFPESLAVRVVGAVAIATGVFRTKGVEGGKPYLRRDRFIDTWINKGGTWVCVSASATPVLH
jgi:ketosteroid isomerase-like protein